MSTQKKVSGVVASTDGGTLNEKSNWTNYKIVFEDGTDADIGFPPAVKYVPKAGDLIGAFEGPFGWIIDKSGYLNDDFTGLREGGPATSSRPTASGGRATSGGRAINSSDSYWKNKTKYEQEERDPKIEFQSYLEQVTKIYAAALPTLTSPPTTVEQLNLYFDDAWAKAKEMYKRENAAKAA